MFSRWPAAATPALLQRGLRTDALSRLQLDINAAHNAQQNFRDPAPPVEKSAAAIRGESLRGDVQLPRELQEAVNNAIQEADDKPGLRLTALELYAHLRQTAAIAPPPASYRERQALMTTYDDPTSLAYLAGLMPSVYGATLHALTMAQDRLRLVDGGTWEPERILDFGSGTASAAWAFDAVWGGREGPAKEYIGLDASRSMVELGSSMIGALPKRIVERDGDTRMDSVRLDAKVHQLGLPASANSFARLQLAPKPADGTRKPTIAIAAFSLGDMGSKEKRKELVRTMWESNAEVFVIVDRGTPAGSRIVLEAREQLLMFGRRSARWAEDLEAVEGPGGPAKGSFVLAPCPHDGACPLHNSTKTYCHFSQRVRSPPFLRHTKHTTRGEDDAKFSYVVIQRGQRPASQFAPTALPVEPSEPEDINDLVARAVQESEGSLDLTTEVTPATAEGNELAWPRVVAAPLKRSGHIILEVCAGSGELERHTIPKSQGRQEYYDARKVAWGDSFPHPPKNGPQPAPAALATEELKSKRDKFGEGKSKVRSKKAERTGRVKEEGIGRRGKGKQQSRSGEVQEFELEMGPDGQLRMM